jgi:hypothetical protein
MKSKLRTFSILNMFSNVKGFGSVDGASLLVIYKKSLRLELIYTNYRSIKLSKKRSKIFQTEQEGDLQAIRETIEINSPKEAKNTQNVGMNSVESSQKRLNISPEISKRPSLTVSQKDIDCKGKLYDDNSNI